MNLHLKCLVKVPLVVALGIPYCFVFLAVLILCIIIGGVLSVAGCVHEMEDVVFPVMDVVEYPWRKFKAW